MSTPDQPEPVRLAEAVERAISEATARRVSEWERTQRSRALTRDQQQRARTHAKTRGHAERLRRIRTETRRRQR